MDVDKTCPGGEKITSLNTIKKLLCVEKQLLILTYAAAGETQYMLSKTVKFISILIYICNINVNLNFDMHIYDYKTLCIVLVPTIKICRIILYVMKNS